MPHELAAAYVRAQNRAERLSAAIAAWAADWPVPPNDNLRWGHVGNLQHAGDVLSDLCEFAGLNVRGILKAEEAIQ